MACVEHNVRMIRLVLRGRVRTPEHAALLADVRRCERCHPPGSQPEVRIPRPRVELVDERLHVGR